MIFYTIFFSYLLTIYHHYNEIISKSKIEKCTRDSSNLTDLKCLDKLVLSLSIQNGQLSETEYMDVFISEVDTPENKKERLQNPFRITISKTPVIAEYPSIYVQDFNFKPVEQIIISDIFSCLDGDLAENPTCGWVINGKNIVSYSQGFCCKCTFSQLAGIDTTSRKRGSSCNFLNLGPGSATAHCLRFDKLWYSAYEIKNYYINYTIDIYITYYEKESDLKSQNNMINQISSDSNSNVLNNQSSSDFKIEKISLTPSNTIVLSNDKKIKASLIGDFQPPTPPDDYSDYFLTIPTYPEFHTMVKEGPNNWMLIPKTFFSLDGRECNKIGVGYFAFRFQGDVRGCEMKVGECLNNQIYDLYISDIQSLAVGKSAKYLLSQDKSKQYTFSRLDSKSKKFAYKLDGVFNTLITLELVADDIKFVTNVSKGLIDFVKVETFESSSNDGSMQIQVTNSGSLRASFFLAYNCTEYILPILGNEFSLSAFESIRFNKEIFTLNEDYKNHQCKITLKNAIGEINDEKITNFNSTRIINNNNQNPNMSNVEPLKNKTDIIDPNDEGYIILECKKLCPDFFDFICFVAHSCWGYFIRTLSIILIILVLIILVFRCIKNGCLCSFIRKIFEFLIGGMKEKKYKNDHKPRINQIK